MPLRPEIVEQLSSGVDAHPLATGRREIRDGLEWLVCTRVLDSPRDEAWVLVTGSEQCAAWAGTWKPTDDPEVVRFAPDEGLSGPGVALDYDVVAFRPPRLLSLRLRGRAGARWPLEIVLEPEGEHTRIIVRQAVGDRAFAPLLGSGVDFCLDRLVAVTRNEKPPGLDADAYFIREAEHYRRLFPVDRRA